jgi:hypothetical protein
MYRRRIIRRQAKKSQVNLIITLIFVAIFAYASINWILPNFIGGLGLITNFFNPPSAPKEDQIESATLAPPELIIPYETTNISTISIDGYAVSNSEVELYLDGRLIDTAGVSADGTFRFENIPLSLGTNNFYGQTVDEDGKKSLPSKTQRVIYDNEKPPLEIFEPTDGQQIQGNRQLTISGLTKEGALIFINDSQSIVDHEGKFKTIVQLSDGENNFNIKAQDSAGNTTEVSRRVIFSP